jgi:hypothetical protein
VRVHSSPRCERQALASIPGPPPACSTMPFRPCRRTCQASPKPSGLPSVDLCMRCSLLHQPGQDKEVPVVVDGAQARLVH